MVRQWLTVCCAAMLALPPAGVEAAESKPQAKKTASTAPARKPAPKRIERLACMMGTEDEHARVAIEVAGGRVQSIAYYSKKKPRTCSVHLQRDDAYSRWSDEGKYTLITTEHGDFLIENRPRDVHLIFREVDRMAYCGMDVGRINGSLTVTRGRKECALDRLMDAHNEP
jgi:hypothetical protein